MITVEHFNKCWSEKDYIGIADLVNELLKERDAAEARAEAYREVAIQLVNPDVGTLQEDWAEKNVDGQAQRILEVKAVGPKDPPKKGGV